MKLLTAPPLPWLALPFACPRCGGTVRFEASDLTGIATIKPKQERLSGRWTVRARCPYCHAIGRFVGLRGAAAEPAGVRAVVHSSAPEAAPLSLSLESVS